MAERRPPKATRQTLFPKIGARVNLQPQSMAQNTIEVRNETQLLAALGSLPGAQGNCYGKAINIVGDIVVTQSLTLSTAQAGLTITSPSRARISTLTPLTTSTGSLGAGNSWIRILLNAADVTIQGLSLEDDFSATNFVFSAGSRTVVRDVVIRASTVTNFVNFSSGASGLMLENNNATPPAGSTAALLSGGVVSSGRIVGNIGFAGGITNADMNRSVIAGNVSLGGWTNSGSATCKNSVVCGNTFTGDITLTGGALTEFIVISGNAMSGNDITTVATNGGNTITGNTNVGVLTPDAADDVTGGNT